MYSVSQKMWPLLRCYESCPNNKNACQIARKYGAINLILLYYELCTNLKNVIPKLNAQLFKTNNRHKFIEGHNLWHTLYLKTKGW